MQDRVPLYPGRVTLTPVAGQANTYDMVRADQPTQAGTQLNKNSLLKDATAELYGLGSDAVPDDVLAMLGPYTQYWWKSRTNRYFYEPVLATAADVYISTRYTVQYSQNISFSESGEVSLAEPIASLTVTDHLVLKTLRGKYFIYHDADFNNYMLYAAPNATVKDYSGTYKIIMASRVSSRLANETGDWVYMRSNDRNAYPDSGIVDDVEYQFLGKPLDNAADSPKMEVVSYIGTGTYGASNPCVVAFSFTPKVVFISAPATNYANCPPLAYGISNVYTIQSTGNSDQYLFLTWTPNSLSYYTNSSDASHQYNTNGSEFYVIAIG